MAISIVIVNFNTKTHLHTCLTSVSEYCPPETEVIVVDNNSKDGSVEMVKTRFPDVKLIASDVNLGFGMGNNVGVQHATHEHVMLLNSDAVLQMDTATALSEYLMAHPEVSCVTPRVVLPETLTIQPKTFGFLPSFKTVLMQSTGLNHLFPKAKLFAGVDGDYRWAREMEVGWVSGVCMLMRRVDYLAVEGFDPRFFMYCEDIDLCIKLANRGKIVLLDDFDLIHIGGASAKTQKAKVRNSVWQQRHLLIIIKDYRGGLQQLASKLVIGLGLTIRLFIAGIQSAFNNFTPSLLLRSSWARLRDLFGFKLPEEWQP